MHEGWRPSRRAALAAVAAGAMVLAGSWYGAFGAVTAGAATGCTRTLSAGG